MKKLFALTTVLAASAMVAPAFAGDAPAFKNGFSVSGSAGYGRTSMKASGTFDVDPAVAGTKIADFSFNRASDTPLVGLSVGYQHLLADRFVVSLSLGALYNPLRLQTRYSGPLDAEFLVVDNVTDPASPATIRALQATLTQSLSPTLTAKLGFLMGAWEPYVGVGVVYTSFKLVAAEMPGHADSAFSSHSESTSKACWGIRPVVGFSYHASDALSFFLEGSTIFYSKIPVTIHQL